MHDGVCGDLIYLLRLWYKYYIDLRLVSFEEQLEILGNSLVVDYPFDFCGTGMFHRENLPPGFIEDFTRFERNRFTWVPGVELLCSDIIKTVVARILGIEECSVRGTIAIKLSALRPDVNRLFASYPVGVFRRTLIPVGARRATTPTRILERRLWSWQRGSFNAGFRRPLFPGGFGRRDICFFRRPQFSRQTLGHFSGDCGHAERRPEHTQNLDSQLRRP